VNFGFHQINVMKIDAYLTIDIKKVILSNKREID